MAVIYSDPEIRQNVLDALSHDARIDPSDITVTVTDGTVYLGGSVPTYPQKVISVEDARRVKGVLEVVVTLTVRLTRTWTDQEIRESIRRSLDHESRITNPSRIDVTVDKGVATLSGIVPNNGQRAVAEEDAWTAPGVIDLIDDIVIAPPTVRTDAEIEADVRRLLDRDSGLNPANIDVKVVDRVVYLRGGVPVSQQISRASDDSWTIPGVGDVENELGVLVRSPAYVEGGDTPWIGLAKLTSLLSILIGAWLILSPFVLGYSQGAVPTTVSMITGSLVLVLGAVRYALGDRAVWASWVIAVLGIWLILAPFVLDYLNNPVATTDHVVMGSISFALGVASALSTAPAAAQEVSH